MSDKPPRSVLRRLYAVLGVFIVSILLYQNFTIYAITKNLKSSQMRVTKTDDSLQDPTDEVSVALAALVAENRSYRSHLKRQGINLKECMSKLPQHEIDDFYKRHREELEQEMAP